MDLSIIVGLLACVVGLLSLTTVWVIVRQSKLVHAVHHLAVTVSAARTLPDPIFSAQQDSVPEILEETSVPETPVPEYLVETPVPETPVPEYPVETPVPETPVPETPVDDRVSVDDSQNDNLSGQTISQLRETLISRGIPFNKSDRKPILMNLVKASS